MLSTPNKTLIALFIQFHDLPSGFGGAVLGYSGFRDSVDGTAHVPLGFDGLEEPLLKGSWDLVTWVINKVTIAIITYNPN